jgi:hypothetical protein
LTCAAARCTRGPACSSPSCDARCFGAPAGPASCAARGCRRGRRIEGKTQTAAADVSSQSTASCGSGSCPASPSSSRARPLRASQGYGSRSPAPARVTGCAAQRLGASLLAGDRRRVWRRCTWSWRCVGWVFPRSACLHQATGTTCVALLATRQTARPTHAGLSSPGGTPLRRATLPFSDDRAPTLTRSGAHPPLHRAAPLTGREEV